VAVEAAIDKELTARNYGVPRPSSPQWLDSARKVDAWLAMYSPFLVVTAHLLQGMEHLLARRYVVVAACMHVCAYVCICVYMYV